MKHQHERVLHARNAARAPEHDHVGHHYLRALGIKHRHVAGHEGTQPVPDRHRKGHFARHLDEAAMRLCLLPGAFGCEESHAEEWRPEAGDMLVCWGGEGRAVTLIVTELGAPTEHFMLDPVTYTNDSVHCRFTFAAVCCGRAERERTAECTATGWRVDGVPLRRWMRASYLEKWKDPAPTILPEDGLDP